jgi:hypothetical protein
MSQQNVIKVYYKKMSHHFTMIQGIFSEKPLHPSTLSLVRKLGNKQWRFDKKLSDRWNGVLFCSPDFSHEWRNKHWPSENFLNVIT